MCFTCIYYLDTFFYLWRYFFCKMKDTTTNKHCLNCQTELHGDYCHVCGQKATKGNPTLKEFFLQYIDIVFVWDTRFVKTFKQLLRRPGHVTNEYVSGKFVSYTHPLKLNMFLLFVFITIFLLFHNNLGSSIHTITRDETVFPMLQLQMLTDDADYSDIIESSPLDTVELYAPLLLLDKYSSIVSSDDDLDSFPRDSMMVWTAVLPSVLIEDEVIVPSSEGYYYFGTEDKTGVLGTRFLEEVWRQLAELTTTYLPVIILLTVPFLALMMRMTHRKGGHSKFKHFIFSLHYTALLELLIISLYILHLIAAPPVELMQWILLLGSGAYLTLAIRRVYGTKGWFNAAGKAVLVNIGYIALLMLLFILIFIIATIIAVFQHYPVS